MVLLEQFAMQIFLWILQMIDGLMDIFLAISGVNDVTYNGEDVNILETFIGGNSIITAAFWCIFLLAIGLGCIFAVIGIVKNMVANNRNLSSILGKFGLFLIGTFAIIAVVYFGIMISNTVLRLLADIFDYEIGSLANALFDACVGGTYAENGDGVAWTLESLLENEGKESITEVSADAILGGHHNWAIFAGNGDWKNDGYIQPANFQYLPALIGGIIILFKLLITSAHLAKRLFEIVLMYITMPAALSTLPMDDGSRFKNWRETFVTKIIIVYGAVIGVNIFIICINVFSRMSLQGIGWFGNSLFYIVMLIGGAMMMSGAIELFAKIFGHGEDMNQSRSLFGGMGYMLGHAIIHATGGVARRVLSAPKAIGNKVYSRYHSTHGGAKAAARHDIATARYREQLEARSAAKSGASAQSQAAGSAVGNGASPAASDAASGGAAPPMTSGSGGSAATGKNGRDGKDGKKGDQGVRGRDGRDGRSTPGSNDEGGNKA